MWRKEVSQLEFIQMEPRGRAVNEKFWVQDDKAKLVKLSNPGIDQDQMEFLSSCLLKIWNVPCVEVELCYDSYAKKNGCLVTSFLEEEADVLYETLDWTFIGGLKEERLEKCFEQVFSKYSKLYGITEEQLEALKRDYLRIIFGKCLTENFDSKLENIGLLFNEKTASYRLPPSYDNGFSFKGYTSTIEPVCTIGNQIFLIQEVVEYIMNNYFEYVEDIVTNLEHVSKIEIANLVGPLEIDNKKKIYIIRYIESIKEIILELKIKKEKTPGNH